jgi:hypothetical protein
MVNSLCVAVVCVFVCLWVTMPLRKEDPPRSWANGRDQLTGSSPLVSQSVTTIRQEACQLLLAGCNHKWNVLAHFSKTSQHQIAQQNRKNSVRKVSVS